MARTKKSKRSAPQTEAGKQPKKLKQSQSSYNTVLNRFPREVRDMIWMHALQDEDNVHPPNYFATEQAKWLDHELGVVPSYKPPAMLAVCRQTRDEVGDCYYGKMRLYFEKTRTAAAILKTLDSDTFEKIKMLSLVRQRPEPFTQGEWNETCRLFKLMAGVDVSAKLQLGYMKRHSGRYTWWTPAMGSPDHCESGPDEDFDEESAFYHAQEKRAEAFHELHDGMCWPS